MSSSKRPGDRDAGDEPERDSMERPPTEYLLRLFVAGTSRRSTEAIANLRAICDRYLPGRYTLEIIDAREDAEHAAEANLVATPMLIKELPAPVRKVLGDMSDEQRVLVGLDLARR